MRGFALAVALAPLLAGSAAAQQVTGPLNSELREARAEQAAAEAQVAKFQHIAAAARTNADRLRAEQDAAAQGIEAAEARITAADAQAHVAAAFVAAHRQRLSEEQRPISALLAGLAVMARRPPLLALAANGSAEDLVKIRVLIDSTMPVIRRRSAGLAAQLSEGQRLERAAIAAREETLRSRQDLVARRMQFASLEQRSLHDALVAGGGALKAGDVAIAAGEDLERISREQSGNRSAREEAAALAQQPAPPARPFGPEGPAPHQPFAYALPADAAVTDGLASVDSSGVRSRGIALATARGAPLTAPAAGTVRYSGPFRNYDGVLIIDHGGGWLSLIVNVGSPLHPGDRIALGQPVGRALGPIQVELSHNGSRYSPALIAGSSQTLSKTGKGG